ncbi:MAG: O-succinylhomoserine sulfhydrylase [Gammaproteobacteria bacterium]|nr:O-succinylhomoserine sulfhydrylase [Gammaproteobacteria bacterium]
MSEKEQQEIESQWGFDTRSVRAGQVRSQFGEHSEIIYTTSSFVFDSAEQAANRFSGVESGYVYSRFSNPTITAFQKRLAILEEGESCVAFASGMSAISSTCLALLQQGDHIVSSRGVFGATAQWFNKYLPRYGIEVSYVPLIDLDAWRKAIRKNTKFLYLETPSNPLTEIADVRALANLAHEYGCLLVVDNCFCSPALQKPLTLGADIVIHSATKYLDGQGRAIGGAVVGSAKIVGETIFGFLRTAGPSMSPFNAWVFINGMETLRIRMEAHSHNALQVAQWLETQPQISRVFYPGLRSHPQHELAKQQQSGFGGIVSFEMKGGRDAAWRVIDSTSMLSITANLGDAKTTITHPATTTHAKLSPEEKTAAGITEGLIRIAVGLETAEDIIKDLQAGFA